ncbi:MAG: hypothetical protein HOQ34_03835 [Gemmatimonadaceae bacterium]|nr:hypothetical protein [Gemmatimonadaceae bacterium]
MPATELTRKRDFKKALIDAGMTATAWAATHGISRAHLNRVLADARQSQPLTEKIDAFIRSPKRPRQLARAS